MSEELKERFVPLIKPLMFLMAFSLFLLLAPVSQASAAAISVSTDLPTDPTVRVPVNQIITVTTDIPSIIDWSSVTLVDSSGTGVLYKEPISNSDTNTIIVPTKMLNFNEKYTLTIPALTVRDPNQIYEPNDTDIVVEFTTVYRLSDLLKDLTTFNSLVQGNSPRKINVIVPKKYMTKFDISYTSLNEMGNPITNVDINAENEVKKIGVQFASSTVQYAVKSGAVWNAGYVGTLTTTGQDDKGLAITLGKDIIFTAYDEHGRILEKNIIKLNPKGQKIDLSSARSLAVSKTFADLIVNNGKLFTDIYKYYSASDLTLSVTNE